MKKFTKILHELQWPLFPLNPEMERNKTFSKYKKIAAVYIFLGLIFLSNASWSQIYTNTFTGASSCPTPGNIPVVAANATGTILTRSTTTCTATANVFNSTTLNATAAISNTSYIEFSASANAGFKLDLTSLSFFRQGSATAPNQLEVRYSTDGFATFTAWGLAPNTPTTGAVATWDFADFSTAGAGTITFRFYPFGTTRADLGVGAAAASGTFRLDDVTLNGSVSASVSPSISVGALTPGTAFSTFQGTPSAAQTFTINGANLSANLTVASVAGYEYSDDAFATAGQSSLSYSTTTVSITVSVRLTGVSTGTFNGGVVISSTGASGSPASVSLTGTVLSATPTITVGALTPAGSFSTTLPTPSTAKTFSLNGTNLTATLNVAAVSGYEYSDDGFATAGQSSLSYNTATVAKTISVRLTGASSGTFNGSIAITSTGATGSPASIAVTGTVIVGPVIAEVILPQYMQGNSSTNSNRLPYTCLLTINTLIPNATYNYFNAAVISSDLSTSNGAGNCIYPSPGGFVRTTSASLSSAGNFGTFTANGSGSYTGWFVLEPTGNARFTPGTNVFIRVMLNDGAGGTAVAARPTTINSVTVVNLVAAAGTNNGTGLMGNSFATDKNFVVVYDNVNGTGRPVSASFVESDGTANTTLNSYAAFYGNNVEGVSGAYGLIVPNTNANGIRRIEQRTLATGSLVGCAAIDADGIWPGGANTVNPSGGTTALTITSTDAPLAGNFNILASAGSGGTISSAGISSIVCGNNKTYTISPNPCFIISNVTVDGVSQGAISTFTFTNIQSVHFISATFISAPPAVAGITNNSGSGVLTCNLSSINLTANGNGSFLWDNGSTIDSRVVSSAGTYIVTVTTPQGCSASASVIITLASPLTVTTGSTPIPCFGGTNGTATALPSGGVAPYAYLWSNSSTSQTATGLSAGIYTVVITDAGACTTTSSVAVNQPLTALTLGTPLISNVQCNGSANGSVDLSASVTGGTLPYSYLWSTTQTTSVITNLSGNTYSVTVTDFGGCSVTAPYFISEPNQLIAGCTGSTAGCNGAAGSVSSLVSGGTPAYLYLWSNGSTNVSINSLTAGTYTVSVTDAHGCTVSAQGIVTASLSATANTTNNNCRNGSIGSVSLSVSGGVQPYTYLWNNGSTNASRNGLASGSYTVTVSDAAGCTKILVNTITQPATSLLTNSSQTNVRCNGMLAGVISIAPFGGTAPYSYSWNTFPVLTTSTITGLAAGVYTCTFTDAIGCSKQIAVTLTQPSAITGLQTQTNVSFPGGNDGTASVVASGGTPGYTYNWNTVPVKTTASVSGLSAGTYKLTITDSKSCSLKLTYIITEPFTKTGSGINSDNVPLLLMVSPNPSSGISTISFNTLVAENFILNVTDLAGRKVYNKMDITSAGKNQLNFDFSDLNKGVYFMCIEIGNSQKIIKLVLQ